MSRSAVMLASASFVLAFAGVASAGDCPPGSPPSWFCEDSGVQPPSGAKPPADAPDHEDADDEDDRPRDVRPMPEPPPPPPAGPPVRQVSPAKSGAKRWREKFGVNLRLEGVPIPDGLAHAWGTYEDPGMGGLGASFRWRPIPWFALDVGLDALGGVDYSGNDRFESAFSASGMFFLNPQHRVQAYLLAGLHVAHAEVDNEDYRPNLEVGGYSDDYDYVGGQAGVGVEFRVSRRVGIDLDGLVVARTRTDAGNLPEYLDPRTGETGDSSVGGLLRAGITIWF
jgi:hypothetical protein